MDGEHTQLPVLLDQAANEISTHGNPAFLARLNAALDGALQCTSHTALHQDITDNPGTPEASEAPESSCDDAQANIRNMAVPAWGHG